jgi:hypothetical protein
MCSPLSNKRWNGKPRGKRREKERYAKNHFHTDLADIGGTHPLYPIYGEPLPLPISITNTLGNSA